MRTQVRSNFTILTAEVEKVLNAENTDLDALSTLLDTYVRRKAKRTSFAQSKTLDILSDNQIYKQGVLNTQYDSIE